MKKTVLLLILCLATFFACKEGTTNKINTEETTQDQKAPKTYAEISIKEGGHWEGKKYVGEAFTFKNVEYLKAPDSLTDHSYYVRYEGPGWESNKVGYRLYLDWRNAIDIFGKKVDTMVLSKVGLDNYDSYHEDSEWGQDILKAGKSLGIGSYGLFDGNKNVAHFKKVDSTTARIMNTKEGSGVVVNYYGWTVMDNTMDLQADLFIEPDSRMTKATLTPSKSIPGLSTGLVKFEGIDLVKKESENGEWAYIATYGEQTLVPDRLGMALFYKVDDVEKISDSEFDHLVVFNPTTKPITYYFAAAWEKEKEGLKNKADFFAYLDESLTSLSQ
ncbi:DUF4861 family protein [Maribacter polysiphoniae]|uniref:DUF4861 family protein n=1 Tax=Maribacter polysiphoniae TaxID=429344 RepID=A0A316E8R3_9FLAO|nr:DUF4861 family protein [Maribacter polysiphoniae]MBD1262358.1 DUF4861 family protein [Maribacter polysiphoniae]PWK26058.1 uncharacterized protein DUF4861 [Maribacter polysiphoniae]